MYGHPTEIRAQVARDSNRRRDSAANEPAVLAGQAEGVHQMRVGVRRLRAAISVFSELLHCKQTGTIKQDLKWLAGKLGPVRDLDVFLDTKVKRLAGAEPAIAGLADLVNELEYRRAVAAEAAKAAIASSRYRLLILSALEWIEDGAWLKRLSGRSDQRVKPFARDGVPGQVLPPHRGTTQDQR